MVCYLPELEALLQKYGISSEDVCIVNSFVFAVNQIRENRDIDFVIRSDIREKIVKTENPDFIIHRATGNILFGDRFEAPQGNYAEIGISDDELFTDEYSQKYGKYRVVRLELAIAKKIVRNREKDRRDMKMILNSDIWTEEMEKKVEVYLKKAERLGWKKDSVDAQEQWEEIFHRGENIYIYGAGDVAKRVYNKVKSEHLTEHLSGFVVTQRGEDDPIEIEDKHIFEIDEITNLQSTILVCVKRATINTIKEKLMLRGFLNVVEAYKYS